MDAGFSRKNGLLRSMMKIQKYIFYLCIVVLGLLILMSCVGPVSTLSPHPSATLSPTILASPDPTQTPSRTPIPAPPTPTFVPTLSFDQEQHVGELLEAKNCKLPCYLGITPGKTTLSEARTILKNLGASYMGEYKREAEGAISYTYLLDVGGQPGIGETPMPDGSIKALTHYVSLITDTNSEMVQVVEAGSGTVGPGISTAQALAKFRKYWSRYTAREIFLQLGQPDQLYTDTSYTGENGIYLLAVYEKLGVVVQIYGTGKENNICPENEAQSIYLQLSLFSATSQLSIYGHGLVAPTDRIVWLPIDDVLGVSTKDFYSSVIADSSTCFKPKITTP